jgi:hypothetical protein
MNSTSALTELRRIVEAKHSSESDREMVRKEALLILKADPILSGSKLRDRVDALDQLLTGKEPKPLALHVARELHDTIQAGYIPMALAQLSQILTEDLREELDESAADRVSSITDGLLSTLIFRGASLESLYQLYAQVLVPRKQKPGYQFAKKLGLITRIITQPPQDFEVLFPLDQVTSPETFPKAIGGVSFSFNPDTWNPDDRSATLLATHANRLFASVKIKSPDPRTAGHLAYKQISDLVDLVRFEYERDRLVLSRDFLIRELGRPQRARRFSIPSSLSCFATKERVPELEKFVASVDELLSSRHLVPDSRDRVLAAFRLYRIGADSDSLEAKLTNWWSAVEYLVRGQKSEKSIGVSVEDNVAPVLCLTYIESLLAEVRRALAHLKIEIRIANEPAPVQVGKMELVALRQLLSDRGSAAQILAELSIHPYALNRVRFVASKLGSTAGARDFIKQHETRVRWQLQRLWRARCDILHGASSPRSIVLLCANLESYLKVTLMGMLEELRRVPTLSGPEEYFARATYSYAKLLEDLTNGSLAALDRDLADGHSM